ncbi:MAG: hypothetical protein LBD87_06260 [Prevotellaceae bacterium]|jgi:hypothetical protein|nr:hypothetical protein [Prevotellaceae bacterium]
MERETTKKARALIRASYDKVIKAINSGKGKITLDDGVAIDAGKSLRKVDIYSIVSQDIGLGYCEQMIEKYVREYLKEKPA